MKKLALAILAIIVSGCTAVTTMDRSGFYNDATGKYFAVNTITVRDRTGTELHHVMVMDDKDGLFDHATASGRGILAGMTDGTLPAMMQAGGLIGMGAVWPRQVNNNNSSSNGSSANASGGNASGGTATQTQTASPTSTATSTSQSLIQIGGAQ
jgi:hypothetical protein